MGLTDRPACSNLLIDMGAGYFVSFVGGTLGVRLGVEVSTFSISGLSSRLELFWALLSVHSILNLLMG